MIVCGRVEKLETVADNASFIVPHARQYLESVPRMLEHAPKLAISTGSCTVPNYASRAAGRASAWQHAIGAVVVERDGDGWYLRHITGDDATGAFQDLNTYVLNGVVTKGVAVDIIVAGDIHLAQIDRSVVRATWGPGGLVEQLRPRPQVVHDVLDFHARNHHERSNVEKRLERLVAGRQSVSRELEETANLLASICRTGVETVVCKSNHDDALDRLLDSDDGRQDEENLRLWLNLTRSMSMQFTPGAASIRSRPRSACPATSRMPSSELGSHPTKFRIRQAPSSSTCMAIAGMVAPAVARWGS